MSPHCEPTKGFPPRQPAEPSRAAVTMLSYGGGQDSWSLLVAYAFDPQFRATYAPGRFLVLSSDTGDEHPETYAHFEFSKRFCVEHSIEYHHITPDMGYHPTTWPSLRAQYRRNSTVGSKRYPKSCTDNLKLVPLYSFLDEWIGREFNLPWSKKTALKLFAQKHGKIDVLIGLAAKEEKRCASPDSQPEGWRKCALNIRYPLIDLGMDRAACQEYARRHGQPVPPPSNCMLCPWMNKAELVWLERFYPADYQEWVEIEAAKLAKNQHMGEKNVGVWGLKPLPEILKEAKEKYGQWSDEQLQAYRFSHGHNVGSKY